MKFSKEHLTAEAQSTGYRPEILEKVFHLLHLLTTFGRHPFLEGRFALKGGTALNLFLFDVLRLSVDIDLNFIGDVERDAMIAARPKIEEAIQAVCSREGFSIRHMPSEHAGGKWLLRYDSAFGTGGNLEVDLNFLYRVPLWPVQILDSARIGSHQARAIPVLDLHELAAGKLVALLARHASRDLYDALRLLEHRAVDPARLRTAFVVYGAMSRTDWRTVSIKNLKVDPVELKNSLLPLLRRADPMSRGDAKLWGTDLLKQCKKRLDVVLPLTKPETAFLDRLLDDGIIDPEVFVSDRSLADRLRTHPGLLWKALNVREFKSKK